MKLGLHASEKQWNYFFPNLKQADNISFPGMS